MADNPTTVGSTPNANAAIASRWLYILMRNPWLSLGLSVVIVALFVLAVATMNRWLFVVFFIAIASLFVVGILRKSRAPFIILSIVSFVLLAACQVYWVLGNNLLDDITKTRATLDTLTAAVAANGTAKGASAAGLHTALSFLVSYHDSLEDWASVVEQPLKLISDYQSDDPLKDHNGGPLNGCPVPERGDYTGAQRILCISQCDAKGSLGPIGQAVGESGANPQCPPSLAELLALRVYVDTYTEEDVITAHLIQELLQKYILPFLYGLFGAFIYVLRRLNTYRLPSIDLVATYWQRIVLGPLAGVSVAWIFNPLVAEEPLKSLQPFAFAFIAGYAVEVLFSALDRLVGAFSQRNGATDKSNDVVDNKDHIVEIPH